MKRYTGEERRGLVVQRLQAAHSPIKGSMLAKDLGVSRQVIVTDIALLKKEKHPILSTHEGYLYQESAKPSGDPERVIFCHHSKELVEKELLLLVDIGVTVKDVQITHPIYGEISAPIGVSNRKEVAQFIERIEHQNATYLLQLTNGFHRHTISAKVEQTLDEAEALLKENGILWV